MTIMNTNAASVPRRVPCNNVGRAWLLVWLGIGAWFGFGREWLKHTPPAAQANAGQHPAVFTAKPKIEAVQIAQMKVGDQVPADNPTGERDTEFGETVDPASWRKLVLLASKKDGSKADVELLRPALWLDEQHAVVGGIIDIQVPECGIEGKARVLDIQPCPAIRVDSRFRIVTGTFKHQASKILDVYVDGLDEPIGTTPNHPFWSEDRRAFVRADQLSEGERLRAFNGTPIVRRIVPLPDPQPVFNLEIQCDHVYYVAQTGLLVHNGSLIFSGLTDALKSKAYDYQLVNDLGEVVYYGMSNNYDNLLARRREHIIEKAGEWAQMQVIAEGLTQRQAWQLETHLMVDANGNIKTALKEIISAATPNKGILQRALAKLQNNPIAIGLPCGP